MKTIILPAVLTICCGLLAIPGFTQQQRPETQKREEIIIRKNEVDPSKTVIVIDSNQITINGQPLADYNGDVSVMKRNFMGGDGERLFRSFPRMFQNSSTAFLGVMTTKGDQGALIKKVVTGSSAAKAGLKEGDVITRVGDQTIASPEELRSAVESHNPGEKIQLRYVRNGKTETLSLELGKNTSGSSAFYYNMDPDSLQNLLKGFDSGRGLRFRTQPFSGGQLNQRPELGLKIQDMEEGQGVKVLEVLNGSAADKAGLKAGDILLEINGKKVTDVSEAKTQILQAAEKNSYLIKAKRDQKIMDIEVQIPRVLNSIHI